MAANPLSTPRNLAAPRPENSGSNSEASAVLQAQLQKLTRRRRSVFLVRNIGAALVPALAISSVGVLLYKLHVIPDAPIWLPLLPFGAAILWGVRGALARQNGDFDAARDADHSLGLEDRLSSALAFVAPQKIGFARKRAPRNWRERVLFAVWPASELRAAAAAPATNFVPALVHDAATQAQSLEPRRVYPLIFGRKAQVLSALFAVFLSLCAMPDFPVALSAQEKKDRVAIAREGEKLVAVAKEIRKQTPPAAAQTQELNRKLERLGQKMARGRMTRRAALTEMGELKKQLEKAQKQPGQSGGAGAIAQIPEAVKGSQPQSPVGRDVKRDLTENKAEDAAKKLDGLAEKIERNQLSKTEKEQVAKDLESVARELRQRGGEANENAAKKFEDAAKSLRQEPQNGGQNQQSQNGSGQNSPQQNQQNQSQNGQQNQNGQSQNGQNSPQQNQNGQQNSGGQQQQQGQSQNGQQNQNQNGQQQQGQNGQQQQGQSGQQGQNGQSQSGASEALRDMANGLRQNSNSSGGQSGNLNDMMQKLREAENGTNGSGQNQGTPPTQSPNAPNFGNSPGQMPNGGNQNQGPQNGNGKNGQGQGQGKSGKSGNGQGQGGQQNGQGNSPSNQLRATDGRGNNGGGPGLGPRDQSTGNKGGGSSNMKSRRTDDKRRYADVWSDKLPAARKKVDRITGKWGSGGEIEQTPTQGQGKGGPAKTPYYDVYESYKKDAEDAVGREAVPPAYRDSVKDYFESIKP